VLLVLSAVSYRSIIASRSGTGWVGHTHEVIGQLSNLQSAMQDIEVGYRGFVLVGDDRFLASYGEGIGAAPKALAAIATLTVNNPAQQRRIPGLTEFVRREIELADEIVRVRYDAGLRAASDRVAGGETLRLMDDVRNLIRDMHDEEERLLVARQLVADRNYKWMAIVLALGIVAAIMVLGSAGWMVSHDATALRASEQGLRTAKDIAEPQTDPRASFSRT
jgi:methyl-accepting chemotaxis protein